MEDGVKGWYWWGVVNEGLVVEGWEHGEVEVVEVAAWAE